MRKLNLVIVCSLLLQSFAWASPKDSLKSVVDEYRFALTVDWDQKDQVQLEKIRSNFSEELKKVVVQEKVSANDLQAFISENSYSLKLNDNVLDSIKDANGNLDLELAQQMLENSSEHLYMSGSSWSPEQLQSLLLYGVLSLVVFELVVLIITARDDKCPTSVTYPNDVDYVCEY